MINCEILNKLNESDILNNGYDNINKPEEGIFTQDLNISMISTGYEDHYVANKKQKDIEHFDEEYEIHDNIEYNTNEVKVDQKEEQKMADVSTPIMTMEHVRPRSPFSVPIALLTDLLLISLLLKDIIIFNKDSFERNSLLCLLKLYSYVLNYFPHCLKQEVPISILTLIIYLLPKAQDYTLTLILLYSSALPQVIRLKETWGKYYLRLRKIRIAGGPVYGCLLFWSLLSRFSMLKMIAFIIFNIGVCWRPDKEIHQGEEAFNWYSKKHGYFMKRGFFIVLTNDLLNLIVNDHIIL
jgi:hypothetical protein